MEVAKEAKNTLILPLLLLYNRDKIDEGEGYGFFGKIYQHKPIFKLILTKNNLV